MAGRKKPSIRERDLRERLAKNIVRLRKMRGWSQEETGHRVGLHDKHLQKMEYAEVNVTLSSLAKLCGGFKVDMKELFEK